MGPLGQNIVVRCSALNYTAMAWRYMVVRFVLPGPNGTNAE